MAKSKAESQQKAARAREEQAWQFRAQGWTLVRIGEELEVDPSTVCKALARVQARRLAELKELVDQERTLQHCRLDHLYDEAMQAWERSKTRPRKRKPKEGEGAAPEASPELREGNPKFLGIARQVLADLRKLWGLDAPSRHLIGATTGADLGKGERDEILRQLGLVPDEPKAPRKASGKAQALPPEPAPEPEPDEPASGRTPEPRRDVPDGVDLGAALDLIAASLPPPDAAEEENTHQRR